MRHSDIGVCPFQLQSAEALQLAGRVTEEELKADLAKLGGDLPEALTALRDAKACGAELEQAEQDGRRYEAEHQMKSQEARDFASQASQAESRARKLELAAARREEGAAERELRE